MKCLTYAQIRKMAEDAEWAVLANWNDAPLKAIKYQKVAMRLRNSLWSFPAENILLTNNTNGPS
jgi:hypothetical protein